MCIGVVVTIILINNSNTSNTTNTTNTTNNGAIISGNNGSLDVQNNNIKDFRYEYGPFFGIASDYHKYHIYNENGKVYLKKGDASNDELDSKEINSCETSQN